MEGFLRGWRGDLSPAWRGVLESAAPDVGAVRQDLPLRAGEEIYPGRRHAPIPGAPRDAHCLRAFDRLPPDAVKVVLLGQDPFPDTTVATGRSFEPGVATWPADPTELAPTFRRVAQVLATARTGDASYSRGDAEWSRLMADGVLASDSPRVLFDRLEDGGVLLINSSLTITRFAPEGAAEQLFGHLPLWRPVTRRVLQYLAARPAGHVVYILLGNKAREVFEAADIQEIAERAGGWKTRVDVTVHPHPNIPPGSPAFYESPNPFTRTNELLAGMGAEPVGW
jgi:uracil-DNA glycosylase